MPAKQMLIDVTQPLEEAARAVPRAIDVVSTTSRGSAEIFVDFPWGSDMNQALLRVATVLRANAAGSAAGNELRRDPDEPERDHAVRLLCAHLRQRVPRGAAPPGGISDHAAADGHCGHSPRRRDRRTDARSPSLGERTEAAILWLHARRRRPGDSREQHDQRGRPAGGQRSPLSGHRQQRVHFGAIGGQRDVAHRQGRSRRARRARHRPTWARSRSGCWSSTTASRPSRSTFISRTAPIR